MSRIDEIKEALDAVDYPEHEFRGCCYELLGRLEIAEKALEEARSFVSVIDGTPLSKFDRENKINAVDTLSKALQQLRS